MSEPLSPLNQGLNPLRGAPLWGQLVALPTASPAIGNSGASAPSQSRGALPLWLALQPYANARLCLFEVDRPESRNPVPIRRHVIDCFLEQQGIVGGYNDTAITDPGDVRFSGYLCRSAILPISTSNTFDWLAAELDWATPGFRVEAPLPWDPALLGTVQAPCQGVMWLGDLALLQPEGGLPSGGRAQFAGCLVQHFGADYGPGGIGLLLQPLLGEAIQLILRPHSVVVLRGGDTLTLIAERYGTTVATLRRINPQLESTQSISAMEGDSLAVLAGRHGTTESKLRSLNPVLQQSEPYLTGEGETLSSVAAAQQISLSLLRQCNPELATWPSEEPLPSGTTLLLPVYRSTTPIPVGLQLLVPGYLPSTELPVGEWIYLPARRSASAVEEAVDVLG
ncbi:LysM peptidoglycan-binding domain-containing protein [Vulcanococcus limneticus]|uniref:LysM peptidoglycan-binding domain-containing protein n=1 Tax=Vulcanococcus limneticus TaxID=2170428 RepID=UPI00398C0A38